MVYVVKKFRHYLLANKFVFFTDHQALLYLVNKPCNTGRIVRWFVILLEFDFTVVVKKGTTHQRADHLSRLTSGEKAIGVDDDLPDAYLFNVEMIPHWSKNLVPFLTIGKLHVSDSFERNLFHLEQTRNFVMLAGRLYRRGPDGVLRLCIEPIEAEKYMTSAHVAMGNIHFASDQTIKQIEQMGVFWPTMQKDVFTLVNVCGC